MSAKQSFWPDSDQILHVISMEFLSLEAQTSLAARSEERQLFS